MRKLAMLVVAAVLALGAACGGGDDNADNASSDSGTKTEATGNASAGVGDFCSTQAKNLDALKQQQPTANPQSLKTLYENLGDTLDKAVDQAPSEIKADMRTVADTFKPFLEELKKVNYDFTKLNVQSPTFQKLSSQEFQDASTRISEYYAKTCK
jgi:hypothetical protein